jgi:hypothetical protein
LQGQATILSPFRQNGPEMSSKSANFTHISIQFSYDEIETGTMVYAVLFDKYLNIFNIFSLRGGRIPEISHSAR